MRKMILDSEIKKEKGCHRCLSVVIANSHGRDEGGGKQFL